MTVTVLVRNIVLVVGKVQGDLGSQGKVVRAGGFGANNKGTFGKNRNIDR